MRASAQTDRAPRVNPAALWPLPWPVFGVAAIAVVYLVAPIVALAFRVPWGDVHTVVTTPETRDLLSLTLRAAMWSTAITLVLGVPLALALQRLRQGSAIVRALVLLPLAMPPVVSGLALTALIGRRGLLAPVLDAFGLQFGFAFPGVVAAHVFITLPFVVVTADSALGQLDGEILAAARSVGLGRWRMLRHIILPAVVPALLTGGCLAFARSLGEFGTTLTFAGSMPGVTRTMPLGIYLAREVSEDNAYTLSAVLIGLAVACLALTALPALWRRTPRPTARTIGEMDIPQLEALTRPTPTHSTPQAAIEVGAGKNTTRFHPGRVTAIAGPNGSGKTTLAGTIAGRLTGLPVRTPDNARIVLLTQRPGLPRTTTVGGAITMVTRDSARTTALLEAAGLAALADVRVPALSGGQAAQVALVRALAARPDVIILDEPLAAIDVAGAARWRQFLRYAARSDESQRTVLMVTHDAVDLRMLARDLAVLEAGEVVAHGPARELMSAPPTDFLAALAGLNRVAGTVSEAPAGETPAGEADKVRVRVGDGRSTADIIARPHASGAPLHPADRVFVVFPPEALRLHPDAEGAPGTVVAVTANSAASLQVTVDALDTQLVAHLPWASAGDIHLGGIHPGDSCAVSVESGAATAY